MDTPSHDLTQTQQPDAFPGGFYVTHPNDGTAYLVATKQEAQELAELLEDSRYGALERRPANPIW